jgi:proline iminopeptidase
MLPAHLQQTKRDDPNRVLGPPPPLGVTGVLCDSHTISIPNRGKLHYTIFRPRNLKYNPPLICVAGGPLLPSMYLSQLVHVVVDRSIILYDAIGCGQSPALDPTNLPTVNDMTDDLEQLINKIECESFHLFGHSFGGILVYEYVKRNKESKCRSVILASTPVSIRQSELYSEKLKEEIEEENPEQIFRERHECRVTPMPSILHQCLERAGFHAKNPAGLDKVRDYNATDSTQQEDLPPALILRGQHDFVDADSCHAWSNLFSESQCMTLSGCSHYGMVEQESLYGSVLTSFLHQNEPAPKPLVFKKKKKAK